jgi:methyl-accepting chemotaxis protein
MASDSIQSQAFNQLESVRSIKKAQISNYISSLKASLQALNNDPYASEAFEAFDQAITSDGLNSESWRQAETKYTARFKEINDVNARYDLFLINLQGDIVYSASKESDLGVNIPQSPLNKTSIGDAFQKAQQSNLTEISVSDFKPYPPSNNEPAAFMMATLVNLNGMTIGYIALQFPLNKVNKIIRQRDGMGETASRIIIDYNGNSVLSSYSTLDLGDFKWALIAEIDEAEAFETANTLINLSTGIVVAVSVIISFVGRMSI